jgi:CHASE2 domain-containing sensor protein
LSPPLRRIQWPRVQWSDLKSKAVRFGLLLGALAFACALVAPHIGLFQRLELTTEDIRLRLRGQRPVHPAIMTVEIEKESLKRFELKWPFPRDQYAVIFSGLKNAGARAVGVDLLFLGPDVNPPVPGNPISNDQLVAAVIDRDPRIVNAFYFPLQEKGDGRDLVPRESLATEPGQAKWERFTTDLPDGVELLRTTDVPFDMEQEIADASADVGHVGLFQDVDGTIRALPLMIDYRGRAWPSMSLVLVSRYLGANWRDLRFTRGKAFLPYPGGELTIPVDRRGQVLINYPGPERAFAPGKMIFIELSDELKLRDSLEMIGKPVPTGQLEKTAGKIVILCNTATETAFSDFGQSPFAQTFPLAYTHASVVNSMLRGDYLSKVPRAYQAVFWLLLAVALAIVLAALTPVALALTVLGTVVALFVISFLMVAFGGQIIEVVPPVLMIGAISLGHLLRGYIIRDRQRRAQEQELGVARRIQQDLLPKSVLAVGGLEILGANKPCFEVGGDYFDYFKLADGRIALAIADVAGKGVGAALLMSNVQAILRSECARGTEVPQVPAQANRQLMESLAGNSKFVTFFYGALDPAAKRLFYSNAGHNPPLVVRANGAIEELEKGGLILGVFPMAEYEEGVVDLASGDLVVLFTDGVTEAESRHGLYSDERLQELLLRERGRGAKEIAQAILADVDRFSHGRHQTDDVTVIVVKVA